MRLLRQALSGSDEVLQAVLQSRNLERGHRLLLDALLVFNLPTLNTI